MAPRSRQISAQRHSDTTFENASEAKRGASLIQLQRTRQSREHAVTDILDNFSRWRIIDITGSDLASLENRQSPTYWLTSRDGASTPILLRGFDGDRDLEEDEIAEEVDWNGWDGLCDCSEEDESSADLLISS